MTDNGVMAANDDAGHGEGTEARPKARDLNDQIRYTMWSVFRVAEPGRAGRRSIVTAGLAAGGHRPARPGRGKGTATRGCYDVQGLRADADYMFWWHAPTSDDLQEIYARFRRTGLGRASEPVWSAMALHRPAEFNKGHIPAFLADEEPKNYVSVYPFVRSYEWYLLDDGRAPRHAGRARQDGPRVPGRAGQHGGLLRAERLRVDAGLRGRTSCTGSST